MFMLKEPTLKMKPTFFNFFLCQVKLYIILNFSVLYAWAIVHHTIQKAGFVAGFMHMLTFVSLGISSKKSG